MEIKKRIDLSGIILPNSRFRAAIPNPVKHSVRKKKSGLKKPLLLEVNCICLISFLPPERFLRKLNILFSLHIAFDTFSYMYAYIVSSCTRGKKKKERGDKVGIVS